MASFKSFAACFDNIAKNFDYSEAAEFVGNEMLTDIASNGEIKLPRLFGKLDQSGEYEIEIKPYGFVLSIIYSTPYAKRLYYVTGAAQPYTYYRNGSKREAPAGGSLRWIEGNFLMYQQKYLNDVGRIVTKK